MSTTVRHCLIILSVAVLAFFTNLGGTRLWDRDEPRNAGCAAEMMARGDWVTPVFNGELRTAKPVLLYWLIMSAYSVLGVNELAARFWSAALGAGTVLAVYAMGRRLFNAEAALWSAVILATSLMFDVAARAATPDSTLIFFSTAALLVFVWATFPRAEGDGESMRRAAAAKGARHPASRGAAVLMYALMGAGVLAKGPVGLVLPTAVIGMFLLILRLPAGGAAGAEGGGRLRRAVDRAAGALRPFAPLHFLRTCWAMRPLTALAAAGAVAAPWYIWVGLRTDGQWLRGFFLTENIERALRPMEHHGGSLLYYPTAICLGFFPWSLWLAPMLIDSARRIRRRSAWSWGYIFVSCWVGVYVALFSMARTKLPSYVTPAYPALALMAGSFFHHWTRGGSLASARWPRVAIRTLGGVGLVMLAAVAWAAHQYAPSDQWLAAVGLIPLAAAVAGSILLRRGEPRRAGAALTAGALGLTLSLFAWAAPRVDRLQKSEIVLKAIDQRIERPEVGALGCLEPSWVFYGRRPIRELTLGAAPGAETPGKIREAGPGRWRPGRAIDAAAFLAGGRQRCILTTPRYWSRLQVQTPPEVGVLQEAPYFCRDDSLLLVGWKDPAARTAQSDDSRPEVR